MGVRPVLDWIAGVTPKDQRILGMNPAGSGCVPWLGSQWLL